MDEVRCALEFRADESRESPGRLVGTLLTYGERAGDRAEVFEAGSLIWTSDGVVLNRAHSDASPIMRVVPEVRGEEVVIDSALPNTTAGRDAAEELRTGLLKGLSVEFRAIRQTYRNGVRIIQEAMLGGAGLVTSPAYQGSTAEVRKEKGRARRWRSM